MSEIINKLSQCAINHGEDCGELDASFSDFQTLLKLMWGMLTPEQQFDVIRSEDVETLLELGARGEITPEDLEKEMASAPLEGASQLKAIEVNMQDLLGTYETPDEHEEWAWVESIAVFKHVSNGVEAGVWEFWVHVENAVHGDKEIPALLLPYFEKAQQESVAWVLFYQ